jgi:hypothetical protein
MDTIDTLLFTFVLVGVLTVAAGLTATRRSRRARRKPVR